MLSLLEHRMIQVERALEKVEPRLHAVEIAQARILGWAAGGAFIGGVVWNVVSRFIPV
jgi:hypothetical protein